ncbi:hypothetical protein ACHAQJ_010290 [Trichoderma viride]
MSRTNSVAYIHPLYRLFFQKIEPLITLWTGYANYRNRSFAATFLFNTNPVGRDYVFRDVFVLEQTLSLMAALTAMSAIVMYYSDDLRLWRRCQLVLLIWNLSCLKGTSDQLPRVGAFQVGHFAVECIYCVELCTALILVRLMFLFNVGNRRQYLIKNGVIQKL